MRCSPMDDFIQAPDQKRAAPHIGPRWAPTARCTKATTISIPSRINPMLNDRNVTKPRYRRLSCAYQRSRRRGFTLIEILVVLGIIILLAAAAVPAFRFIVGARSLDGAQNVAGAMVGL